MTNDSGDMRVCPYFQGKDDRCARRFNLQGLSRVFEQCLDEFGGCTIYLQLSIGATAGSTGRAASEGPGVAA